MSDPVVTLPSDVDRLIELCDPDLPWWHVKRTPWQKPCALTTRARTRRQAREQYRAKLRREGERVPLVVFTERWK